jgi:hypothetical protein
MFEADVISRPFGSGSSTNRPLVHFLNISATKVANIDHKLVKILHNRTLVMQWVIAGI